METKAISWIFYTIELNEGMCLCQCAGPTCMFCVSFPEATVQGATIRFQMLVSATLHGATAQKLWDDIFGLCLCLSHQFTQLRFGNTRRWWETLGDILNRDKSCDYTKWGHLQFTMWVWAFGWKFRAHPLSWVTPTPARTEPLTENSLRLLLALH